MPSPNLTTLCELVTVTNSLLEDNRRARVQLETLLVQLQGLLISGQEPAPEPAEQAEAANAAVGRKYYLVLRNSDLCGLHSSRRSYVSAVGSNPTSSGCRSGISFRIGHNQGDSFVVHSISEGVRAWEAVHNDRPLPRFGTF